MQIYITQGHERGVGLEVFFKACVLMPQERLNQLTLLAYPDAVEQTLKSVRLPFSLKDDEIEVGGNVLKVRWLKKAGHSQSFTALELGMRLAESGGILYTLPTSKDQFPGHAGHTEYFRAFYHRPELGMFFSSPAMQVLLLSDHVPLVKVTETLTSALIYERLNEALNTLRRWKWPIEKVLVAGFNPHAGEAGLIGSEDARVTEAIARLRGEHGFAMSGPLPGDTMLLSQSSPHDLMVYLYHDQGLGVFKGLQGFVGSNITLGLPYPRFSPDHGTSFQLYGKNAADHRGCAWSLNEALSLAERTAYGKNSGQQGQSS